MRTTVTLDRDLEQILREVAVRTHRPFKKVLNDTLRSALESKLHPYTIERFVVHPKAMELRAGLDPAGFNRLVDDLEAEAYLETTRQLASHKP